MKWKPMSYSELKELAWQCKIMISRLENEPGYFLAKGNTHQQVQDFIGMSKAKGLRFYSPIIRDISDHSYFTKFAYYI